MSDIRVNRWLHRPGTGGVYQDASGNVGIGTSVPTSALDIIGTVKATELRVNTIQGPVGIDTLSSVLSLDKPFLEMNQTITEDYTITESKNALTVGPVAIADDITVTIPSDSNWVIV